MSYLDPNKGRQAARAAMRQEHIAQAAAARAMVKEAFRDDYNKHSPSCRTNPTLRDPKTTSR